MEISKEVLSHINDFEAPLKKELSYIKKNNWSIEDKRYKRINKQKTNGLLVSRSIGKLVDFHKIASEYIGNKTIDSHIKLMLDFFDIFKKRYEKYIEIEDWTKYSNVYGAEDEESEDKLAKEIEDEVEFQSDLLNSINSLGKKIDNLNLDGDRKKIELPIHSDIPAPFLLKDKLIKLFPEIQQYLDEKK